MKQKSRPHQEKQVCGDLKRQCDTSVAHVYARLRISVCKALHKRIQNLAQTYAKTIL